MNTNKSITEEIIAHAKKWNHYNDLLIEQCDNWLPENEGLQNVEKRIKKAKSLKAVSIFCLLITACCFSLLLAAGCGNDKSNVEKPQIVNDTIPMPTFESPADSLEWLVKNGTEEQKIAAMDEMNFREIRIDTMFKYAQLFYMDKKDKNNPMLMGKITSLLGMYYNNISHNVDSSLFYLKQAKTFFEQGDDGNLVANACLRLGLAQQTVYDYENAIENLLIALDYFERVNNTKNVLRTYNNIALTYETMGNRDKQEEYLLKALELSENEGVRKADVGVTLINLALFEKNKGNYAKALEYGKQSVETFRKTGELYERFLGTIIQRYINILDEAGRTDNFLEYYNEAYAIAEKYQDKQLKASLLIALSDYTVNNTKNYQAAYNYAKKAEEFADTTDYVSMNYLWNQLIRCAICTGNKDEGFKYLTIYRATKEKQLNTTLAEKSSELEVKYETEKKQMEIERQQEIIKQQKTQRNIFIVGIAILVIILILLFYLFRQRTRQRRVLAETNAVKDKFFNIISHDLKNPAIMQKDALRLMLNNVFIWNTDTIAMYLSEILKSAEGEVELLYNLLNWAQMQTGRMSYSPTSFDLVSALRPEIALISDMAKNKDISVITELPDDATITGDKNMLNTVIRNLLTNAVKFTPKGGTVTLKITPATGKSYHITVSDTGIGMSEEQIRNLFHLDRVRSRLGTAKETGSGLGLIVCKELLEKHNSTLHIESKEEQGSMFWFEI